MSTRSWKRAGFAVGALPIDRIPSREITSPLPKSWCGETYPEMLSITDTPFMSNQSTRSLGWRSHRLARVDLSGKE